MLRHVDGALRTDPRRLPHLLVAASLGADRAASKHSLPRCRARRAQREAAPALQSARARSSSRAQCEAMGAVVLSSGAKHVRAITAGGPCRACARAVAQRADTAASLTFALRIQEDSLARSPSAPPPSRCSRACCSAVPPSRCPPATADAALLPPPAQRQSIAACHPARSWPRPRSQLSQSRTAAGEPMSQG